MCIRMQPRAANERDALRGYMETISPIFPAEMRSVASRRPSFAITSVASSETLKPRGRSVRHPRSARSILSAI